jgi:hypothetical protein
VNKWVFLLSGFLSTVLFDNNLLWLLNGRTTTHTPLILDFMKDLESMWTTNSEHHRYEADRETSLQEIVQELKFPEPTPENVKLEIKTGHTRQVA